MSDVGARRGVLGRALRRFWPVVILVALVGGMSASWAATGATAVYTAEGEYIVPIAPPQAPLLPGQLPLPPSTLPGNAYDAGVVARTYEVLLAEDQLLLEALSQASGISVQDLQADADVVLIPGTRVLRVNFTADTPEQVNAYFSSLSTIVSTASPTPNLPTGNVLPLNVPTDVETVPGLSRAAPLAGLIAGLLLGLGVAVVLERLDARLNGAPNLRAIAGWPVFDLGTGNPATVMETVVMRVLHDDPATTRVAVVTPPGASAQVGANAALDLADAEVRLRRSGALPADGRPVEWDAPGRLASDGLAERAVQVAGATVFVTPRRARMRSVTSALEILQDLAPSDVVALVVSKRRQQARAAARAQAAAPVVVAAPPVGSAPATSSQPVTATAAPADERPARPAGARTPAGKTSVTPSS